MTIYIINENTDIITPFEVDNINLLSPFLRTLPNREITTQERDGYLLQEAKDSKKLEINKARDEAIYSNITITTENSGSQIFSCFKNISGELNLAITALQNRIDNGETDPTIRFPEVNNSIISMTINDYKAIQNELGLRADYYAQGRELKDSVEACTTIEEVDAINIVFN
jgi:exonuclease III